ncbi:MAG TPA: ABC transporter permease, partial [Acidimicrobiales bacterium]|nr:ABC transporter permease [Acidimicrobiales bacterium]
MSQFLEFTVLGIAIGACYAISATGLVVTYTTSGVFNFAHGAVGMMAAFCYWELQAHHVPVALSLVIILLIGAPVLGALVERVFMRRMYGASAERPIMVTLGLLLILMGAAILIWSPTVSRSLNPLVSGTFPLFGVNLPWQDLVILVIAIVVAVALRFLFYSTRLGFALRAVVDDPDLLTMSGASPNAMSRTGWMMGFFLAALAGVLIAPTLGTGIQVATLTLLVVNGYAAAVVGRLKSIPMTFVGAIVLGLLVTYFQNYVPQHLPQGIGAELTAVLPMVFLFIALVAMPSVRLRAVGRLSTIRIPRVAGGRESVVVGALFIVAAIIFSLFFGTIFLSPGLSTVGPIAGQTMVYGIIALSLVLLTGYAGQVSLCQFAFMGIGAFCMGKVAGGGSLLGLVVAVSVCAAVGALIALPTIRLRGLYLALATFAFAEAVQLGLFADTRVYGDAGLNVNRIVIPGLSFESDHAEFMLVTVTFVLAALLVLAIRRSLFGRRLVAMNDSPAACATIGLNISFTKVAVFAISAGLAGLGGALWGTLQTTVGTTDFDIFSGVMFLLFLVVWSVRTVSGAFLASLTFAVFTNVPGLSKVEGLFAGAGIILIGRAANGILGIEWFA